MSDVSAVATDDYHDGELGDSGTDAGGTDVGGLAAHGTGKDGGGNYNQIPKIVRVIVLREKAQHTVSKHIWACLGAACWAFFVSV